MGLTQQILLAFMLNHHPAFFARQLFC